MTRWDHRFFESTRGRIVLLLRRARATVDDLAGALALTDNAVRAHLATLERDGLVQQHGLQRGDRRPSLVYELTTDAEQLFPKAYEPVLSRLLEVLEDRLPGQDTDAALREVGRRLAHAYPPQTGTRQARLAGAAHVLAGLGGLAEVQTLEDGRLALRGFSCPLGAAVSAHPQVCHVAESLVSELSGVAVEEHCERAAGQTPRCFFVASGDDATPSPEAATSTR